MANGWISSTRAMGSVQRWGISLGPQYIDAAGFYGIRRAGYLTVDHGLINALVERWRQETHTFHLPVMGEATVTLQDVEVL